MHLLPNQFMTYWKPIRYKLGDTIHNWKKGVIVGIAEYGWGALITTEVTTK
jgi:hypothetical protein